MPGRILPGMLALVPTTCHILEIPCHPFFGYRVEFKDDRQINSKEKLQEFIVNNWELSIGDLLLEINCCGPLVKRSADIFVQAWETRLAAGEDTEESIAAYNRTITHAEEELMALDEAYTPIVRFYMSSLHVDHLREKLGPESDIVRQIARREAIAEIRAAKADLGKIKFGQIIHYWFQEKTLKALKQSLARRANVETEMEGDVKLVIAPTAFGVLKIDAFQVLCEYFGAAETKAEASSGSGS